ncbi:hypothetical protein O0I10_000182 [Lichtheimia ornata]|uniref:Solanesyl diphosphate synthase n=1 Tax=Lichtheimia ornata TaxID=688661 RepID=A0AAD7Y4Y5_9FUNG|nr:uncharacterized protein O0I10_000182 [Lichtheimia ornata]KAJ8663907.1 hypothetical protein O0I10_000182 [Lichtheimia ornata]
MRASTTLLWRSLAVRQHAHRAFHTTRSQWSYATKQPSVAAAAAAALANGPLGKGIDAFRTVLSSKPLTKPFTGKADTWEDALCEAQGLVVDKNAGSDSNTLLDPAKLLGPELWELRGNITKLLGSGHPFLNTLMTHFICDNGQPIRPLLVLLMAKAASNAPSFEITESQRRLAEITQMIHVASLLHDDIMEDHASVFGNKMAILAGDFLLARASLALAYLHNSECVELMATCIANLVEGEFMHLVKNDTIHETTYYMDQIEMKHASLIAQSCKGAAVLTDPTLAIHAHDYGRHFGVASQLVEDVLEFNTDVRSTAPIMFAAEQVEELRPLIQRQFSQPDDKDKARLLVYQGDGLKKTLTVAESHSNMAIEAANNLPPSTARDALIQLAQNLLRRIK